MELTVEYLHKGNYCYKTNRGLAERQVRNYFKKKGFEVWRGSNISWQGEKLREFHPDKIDRLGKILKEKIGLDGLIQLSLFAKTNAGLPDFLVGNKEQLFFVEVKLENEQLKNNQVETMKFIMQLGMEIKLVRFNNNKQIFTKKLDLDTKKSRLISYIPKLKLKW